MLKLWFQVLGVSQHYISGRAYLSLAAYIIYPAIVLGPTYVGSQTIVSSFVIVGFPVRAKLLNARNLSKISLEELDSTSSGSKLGDGAIVRSHSVLYENVELGEGVELGHHVLIRENTRLGKGSKIGSGTIVDGYTSIGENTNIQSGVYIPIKTSIGSNVFIGPRAVITNDKYPPSRKLVETTIEDDAVIGANSTIIAGVKIGRGAVVAAGAVVTKDVEPYTVVAGIPAKPVMSRDEYEKKKALYEGVS